MAWSDAARAAALEARRRRKAGQPWRSRFLTAHVALSDPLAVGGTKGHNKTMKKLRLRAVTDDEAIERAKKFYRKRGYKNIHVTHLAPRNRKD